MLHVTLRQLQVFDAVARHLSFSRASSELHLSQPAVSMQVKQLEEALGLPVFEQIGKKIFLTDAGREVQRVSQAIEQQLLDLEGTLADLRGVRGGTLTVGVVSTAHYFATRMMAQFRQQRPDVRLTLNVVNRETLLNQLAANETDLAIMGQPPSGRDLEAQAFMLNPLVVIAPPHHPLAGEEGIPFSRLEGEPMLAREVGSGTRNAMEGLFHEHGLELKPAMEMNKNEAIKQAVEVGLGLGVGVPAHGGARTRGQATHHPGCGGLPHPSALVPGASAGQATVAGGAGIPQLRAGGGGAQGRGRGVRRVGRGALQPGSP